MQRLLLAVVVLLAALLLARDPYVDKADAFFLDWLLRNTPASGDHAPLTVVEIGGSPTVETQPNQQAAGNSPESHPNAGAVSPLDFALFFQGILEFKPTVVAVEPPYVNLPDVTTTRVPLLFNYRGEVIPAFALQAFLTWARIPMSEVQIEIGSHIALPGDRKIPINWDGTLMVNPNWSKLGRRFVLNELLLLAQQRQKNSALESLHEDLILARTPSNLLAPADVFAATIVTLQSNHFVRRVSVLFDGAVVLFVALLASRAVRASRIDLVLGLIAFTAGYCLIAFTVMARYAIWVPGLVPLGTAWLLGLLAFFWPRPKHRAEATEIAVPPPAP